MQQQVVKGKRKTKRVKDLKVIEIAPKSKYKKLERQNQMLTHLLKSNMEFNKVMKTPLFLLGLACGVIVISVGMITVVLGQQQINVSELDTLDRMRYTAIQMTLLSIQTENPTNMTSDEIASEIFMLTNTTPERPTTLEIEQMYMNLTQ